jgi:hypothetical protein
MSHDLPGEVAVVHAGQEHVGDGEGVSGSLRTGEYG